MKQDAQAFLVGLVAGGIATFLLMTSVGTLPANLQKKFENEAISRNFGRYVVNTNKEVKFEWAAPITNK